MGQGIPFYIQHSPSEYYGKTITAAEISDDRLCLTLDGVEQIQIWDDCQVCCEIRYVSTDDDVKSLIGGKLARIEVKEGENVRDDEDEVHEIAFVEVGTDKGFITLVNHNKHNGYYGGFSLVITEVNEATAKQQ